MFVPFLVILTDKNKTPSNRTICKDLGGGAEQIEELADEEEEEERSQKKKSGKEGEKKVCGN